MQTKAHSRSTIPLVTTTNNRNGSNVFLLLSPFAGQGGGKHPYPLVWDEVLLSGSIQLRPAKRCVIESARTSKCQDYVGHFRHGYAFRCEDESFPSSSSRPKKRTHDDHDFGTNSLFIPVFTLSHNS